jgi:hypothetical protein
MAIKRFGSIRFLDEGIGVGGLSVGYYCIIQKFCKMNPALAGKIFP